MVGDIYLKWTYLKDFRDIRFDLFRPIYVSSSIHFWFWEAVFLDLPRHSDFSIRQNPWFISGVLIGWYQILIKIVISFQFLFFNSFNFSLFLFSRICSPGFSHFRNRLFIDYNPAADDSMRMTHHDSRKRFFRCWLVIDVLLLT